MKAQLYVKSKCIITWDQWILGSHVTYSKASLRLGQQTWWRLHQVHTQTCNQPEHASVSMACTGSGWRDGVAGRIKAICWPRRAMSGSVNMHSKWPWRSEVGFIYCTGWVFFSLVNQNKYTSWSGSALQECHIFFSRTQFMSLAQQDLVPRHPSGKFSLQTIRRDEMMLNEGWRCLMDVVTVINERFTWY